MSKRCQDVKKMSNCQKNVEKDVKCQKVTQTMEEVHKKLIHIVMFTHIDVNFDVKYEGHQNCSKILSMHILRGFK